MTLVLTVWEELEKLFLVSEYVFWAATVVFEAQEYVSNMISVWTEGKRP